MPFGDTVREPVPSSSALLFTGLATLNEKWALRTLAFARGSQQALAISRQPSDTIRPTLKFRIIASLPARGILE